MSVARRPSFFIARAAVVAVPLGMAMTYGAARPLFPADEKGRWLLYTTSSAIAISFLVLVPALLGDALAAERSRNRLDVLRSTPLGLLGLLFGKWASRMGILLCMAAAAAPVMASSLVFGGVATEQVLASFAVLFGTLAWTSAVTLYASATTGSLTSALGLAFGFVLGIELLMELGPDFCAPALASEAPGLARFLEIAGHLSPTDALVRIDPWWSSPTEPAADVAWTALAASGVLSAVALGLTALRLRSVLHVTIRRKSRTGVRALWLLRRYPLLWLERRQHGTRQRLGSLLLLLIPVLAAEAVFTGQLLNAADRASAAFAHGWVLMSWLLIGMLRVGLVGSLAFHRDREANVREVLFAAPVTSRRIAWARIAGVARGACPWWMLGAAHGGLAIAGRHLPFESIALHLASTAIILAAVGTFALHVSLGTKTGARAAATVMVLVAGLFVLGPFFVFPLTISSQDWILVYFVGLIPLFLSILPLLEPFDVGWLPDLMIQALYYYLGGYLLFVLLSVLWILPARVEAQRRGTEAWWRRLRSAPARAPDAPAGAIEPAGIS